MGFSIIAAVDSKMGIGKNNKIPWHLGQDMEYFRSITIGSGKNAVIMGRTTWESIPKNNRPLEKRLNIVLTSNMNYALPEKVLRAKNFEKALEIAQKRACEKVFIIGGAKTYAAAISDPRCEEIYITEVFGDFGCDAFFPKINGSRFKKIWESDMRGENSVEFRFARYSKSPLKS